MGNLIEPKGAQHERGKVWLEGGKLWAGGEVVGDVR